MPRETRKFSLLRETTFRMSKSERIKLDNRLRLLIENGVKTNQRSIVCLVGEQGRNQVVHIHNILSKANVKGNGLQSDNFQNCFQTFFEIKFENPNKRSAQCSLVLQKRTWLFDSSQKAHEDAPATDEVGNYGGQRK